MINVDEAYRIILENIGTLPIQEVNIKGAVGLCLAEDAVSDIDMPPFDKSSMDGYAVIAEDTISASGQPVELDVIEGVAAGQMPKKKVERGQATKIMTGAALPQGADAVIKVEDTEPMQGNKVRLLRGMKKGENVSPRGEDFQAGQVVIKRATALRPQEIGILAMIGMGKVKVYSSPKVGISSTGDELVEVGRKPIGGQIRDSNSHCLAAQVSLTRAEVECFGTARDDRKSLIHMIKKGLRKDLLILTGGVSMGECDLVVGVLKELGVNLFFEKVAMKPGKPIVFGKHYKTAVFALPGNPVATYVSFELFVRPAIRKMMGFTQLSRTIVKAQLETPLRSRGERREFRPTWLRLEDGRFSASPVEWHGSADLLGTTRANSLLIVPEGVESYSAGQEVEVMLTGEL
ncbi:MAG: hypothetical protein A3E19_03005 [Planctomycetes bacterium RIFCSPHIGHO2_12_FULL_52_36]|nr:MAG: hypothetical protein A3E19_03005 [Planctomycetes bacterium RIFCSPHIGHO2_12_FULL_52_36]